METFSALLALCAVNSLVTGESPHKGQWRGVYVFFDLRLNKRFSKQSLGWWFDTPPRSLWRHRNEWWLRKRRPHGCYWWLGAYLALGLIPPSRWPMSLEWRHNENDGVFNHQPYYCFLNCSFRCRSKKISTLRVTGLCAWNSSLTGDFPAQMASNAENVSIWWRHHGELSL